MPATDGTILSEWVVLNKFRKMTAGRDYAMKTEGYNPKLLYGAADGVPVAVNISPPPKDAGQTVFTLENILEMFSGIPPRAISGLLSNIVGNQSFRLRVGKVDGYIVYRNGYFMFQPDYLSDIRIPLALRVAEVPVRRDHFDPDISKRVEPVPEQAPAAPEQAPAPAAEGPPTTFWGTITKWAGHIQDGSAELDDIPEYLRESIGNRYTGEDAIFRENDQLIMVNWLYSYIKESPDSGFTEENRSSYLKALGQALLEMMWDENIRPNEQEQLYWTKDPKAVEVATKEQVVKRGESSALRIIDIAAGTIKYKSGLGKPCPEAVARVFDTDAENPINTIQANINTAGAIYGFNIPKTKEGRIIFKTNERPVQPGQKPEKGSECSIVSTIAFHIRMLKDIAELLKGEGYPVFILKEEYLDKKKKGEQAEDEKRRTGTYAKKGPKHFKTRSFENAIRACALKDIMLRWMDVMQREKGEGAKRYFYRPVAALKSGHKSGK
jgi:hypothetical protein